MTVDGPRQSFWRAGVALGAVLFLAGCSLTRLQAPTISLVSAELQDAQFQEQRFNVRLHVQNPNDRPLPIKSVNCTLQIEGVDVGHGESTEPFSVPAHGDTEFDLLVKTNFASSVPDLFARVLKRGALPEYRLSGSVNPDTHWLPPIPFSKSGQITIPQ